jgi:hypothetical protein
MGQNIFLQWMAWQFIDTPRFIIRIWRNFLVFNFNYFSIGVLFRTLFAYWHKYRWQAPSGFSIGKYLEAAASNLVSRVLGAIMRTFLIILGLLFEILILIGGLISLSLWLISPFLFIFGILWSIRII